MMTSVLVFYTGALAFFVAILAIGAARVFIVPAVTHALGWIWNLLWCDEFQR